MSAQILIAEDLDDDIALMRLAVEKAGVRNPVQFVGNGEEAIMYLQGKGKFADRHEYPLPALMILDVKMPRKDGFEVIQWIRAQPAFKALRIIVLSSSTDERDVSRAYELGAASYRVKPLDFGELVRIIKYIKDVWLPTDVRPLVSLHPVRS